MELNKLQPNSFAYNRCQQLYAENNATNATTDRNAVGNKYDNEDGRKSFINTDEFRIMFLRCELFNVPNAARRLINFVELMYELYGDIGLQRRIRLDDLSEEELRILKGGTRTILPGRDRAGRRVVFHITYNYTNEFTAKQRLRISFYVQMRLADDIETQRKGSVLITWYHNVNMFDDFSIRTQVYQRLAACSAIRPGAIHICIAKELEGTYTVVGNGGDSSSGSSTTTTTTTTTTKISPSPFSGTPVNIIKSMIALSLGAKYRSKIRIHTGPSVSSRLVLLYFIPFHFFAFYFCFLLLSLIPMIFCVFISFIHS